MAKSLGTLSKSFEISAKQLWIQRKNRIPLSPPVFIPKDLKAEGLSGYRFGYIPPIWVSLGFTLSR